MTQDASKPTAAVGGHLEKSRKYPHYFKACPFDEIDVYRLLDVFRVDSHAVGHAVKKCLVLGHRGAKDKMTDLNEAIDTLERYREMLIEDAQHADATPLLFGTDLDESAHWSGAVETGADLEIIIPKDCAAPGYNGTHDWSRTGRSPNRFKCLGCHREVSA